MEVVTEYLLQNWALILILLAFAIMLKVNIFLDKKRIIRMSILIASVFILSIIVFAEFYLADLGKYPDVRIIMMAIRYSATPLIIALVLFTLIKKIHWVVFIPALLLVIINVVSIWTGIVFSLNSAGNLVRGPLGYLPYIVVGLYCATLVVVLILESNRKLVDIIPIAYLGLTFAAGLILPAILKKNYSKIFCTTIGIALFVYYIFQILQLTKKDPLTGLLNRQAYYSTINGNPKDIDAVLSIDMNGLKAINDKEGHAAGDEALTTIASCITKSSNIKHSIFRTGGDEFIVICNRTNEEELKKYISEIEKNVSETPYSCAIGYSYRNDSSKTVEQMLKESDEMMYTSKAKYYDGLEQDK